jgi:hypothetical protein
LRERTEIKMGIIGKAAGVVTSFFGVRKPPQKSPVMEGTIVIERSRRKGTTRITSTVAGAADWLQQEALKQGAAVEEHGAELVVVFKGADAVFPWPKSLLPFISHADESPWAITKPVAVVPPKTLPGSVSASPFSLAGDGNVQPPVTVVPETPVVGRSPWANAETEITPAQVGPRKSVPSPFGLGEEAFQDQTSPPSTEIGARGRPTPAPWVPDEKIDTYYPPAKG